MLWEVFKVMTFAYFVGVIFFVISTSLYIANVDDNKNLDPAVHNTETFIEAHNLPPIVSKTDDKS